MTREELFIQLQQVKDNLYAMPFGNINNFSNFAREGYPELTRYVITSAFNKLENQNSDIWDATIVRYALIIEAFKEYEPITSKLYSYKNMAKYKKINRQQVIKRTNKKLREYFNTKENNVTKN